MIGGSSDYLAIIKKSLPSSGVEYFIRSTKRAGFQIAMIVLGLGGTLIN
jgi:hypothetical protein